MLSIHPSSGKLHAQAVLNPFLFVPEGWDLSLMHCRDRYPESLADKSWDNTGCMFLPSSLLGWHPLICDAASAVGSSMEPDQTIEQFGPLDDRPHQSRRIRGYQTKGFDYCCLPYVSSTGATERT
jgi:hypothetical protein